MDGDAEARQQTREAAWTKAAERLVVEALARLAAVGDVLEARAGRAAGRPSRAHHPWADLRDAGPAIV